MSYGDISPRTYHYAQEVLAKKSQARHANERDVAWFTAEIEHWKQRCEELELELLMLENSYDLDLADNIELKPKYRGIF